MKFAMWPTGDRIPVDIDTVEEVQYGLINCYTKLTLANGGFVPVTIESAIKHCKSDVLPGTGAPGEIWHRADDRSWRRLSTPLPDETSEGNFRILNAAPDLCRP